MTQTNYDIARKTIADKLDRARVGVTRYPIAPPRYGQNVELPTSFIRCLAEEITVLRGQVATLSDDLAAIFEEELARMDIEAAKELKKKKKKKKKKKMAKKAPKKKGAKR